jgi:very-short-patch-repair endonuclease
MAQSRTMRRRELHIPYPGARLDAPPSTRAEQCRAYLSRAGADEFISHSTALELHALPIPARLFRDARIHVSVVEPAFPPQVRGVIAHRLQVAPPLVDIDGVPVVRGVDAWLQAAPYLTEPELIETGDALVRRRKPLTTASELARRVGAVAGRRGARNLRGALARIRTGTDSVAETRLRLLICDAGLPEPAVGWTVTHNGSFVGQPDLAYPEQRIAIEYEGDIHRLDLRTFRDDIERRERFEDAGWRVIRVTADHLAAPALLVHRIRVALNERS